MNKLWLFGDSYADPVRLPGLKYHDESYPRYYHIVKDFYNYDLVNTGLGGCSNEYIMDQFLQNVEHIKENDIVLFLPTWHGRRWIFEDLPKLTTYFSYIKYLKKVYADRDITEEEKLKCEQTFLDVVCPFERNKSENYIQMMLSTVSDYKTKIGFTGLIINTFKTEHVSRNDNLINSTGFLHEISNKEFTDLKNFHEKYIEYRDFRSNHLTPQNHRLFGKKIIESIETGKDLDLTSGFLSNIIEEKDIEEHYN